MERRPTAIGVVLAAVIAGGFLAPVSKVQDAGSDATRPGTWNKQAAAKFLDDRETWWQGWPRAQKDHGTVCISCHTVVPYAMVRPELRRDLTESATTPAGQVMLASVEKRVGDWAEMAPFYSDEKYGKGKAAESRATEAVLNAVILASYDRARSEVRPITRKAFEELWALQEAEGPLAGAWKWQDFHLGPWESTESGYQGAALLMVEGVNLSGRFAREAGTREHLDRLRDFLRKNYAAQPVVNQLYVLWASAKEPALLTKAERKALMEAVRSLQQADGGFRTAALDARERVDHTAQPTASDGYATGLVALVLEAVGTPRKDPMLSRSLTWLAAHQQSDGTWKAASLNKQRDPASDPALFMTDAATAYAVMALEAERWSRE
jgi:squalene-hopene/tetraprenyl-beta-curcumene cyclase